MPNYLMTVVEPSTGPGLAPGQLDQIMKDVDALHHEMQDAGVWVFGGGLEPIQSSTTVDNTGTEPIVTDGPFAESKEWIGGFWILELPDLDTALEWATEASKACAGKVEVRPFQPEPPAA